MDHMITYGGSHVVDHVITYLFLSFLPSSLDAGNIIARYGPSTCKGVGLYQHGVWLATEQTSKKMEFSLRRVYSSLA